MKPSLTLLLAACSFWTNAQVLYSPQINYDEADGLYDRSVLRTLELDFEDPNYYQVLNESWQTESGVRSKATLTLDGQVYDSVAVRFKGNSTYYYANLFGNPKVPYNIDINDHLPDQRLLGYKKLKMANALFDPSYSKEVIGYSVYRNYLPSPEACLIRTFTNGDYTGVYANTESIDKTFLKKHFNEKNGILFKCDPLAQYGDTTTWKDSDLAWYGSDSSIYADRYALKSDHGWNELVRLIDILNNDIDEIETILNVDRVLWLFALNTVLLNADAYNTLVLHNYYLYQTKDGLFQIIPWDLSECFVGAMLEDVGSPTDLYEMSPYWGHDTLQASRPLVDKLLQVEEYHMQYTAHIRTIMEEFGADPTIIEQRVLDLQSLAESAVQADQNKWSTMADYTNNAYEIVDVEGTNFGGIMSSLNARMAFLDNHPQINKIAPEISNVVQLNESPADQESVVITAQISNGTEAFLMSTINDQASLFQSVTMLDNGTGGDELANDGIYSGTIPFQNHGDRVKYYIKAVNSEATMLAPKRAAYEYFTYEVGATNVEKNFMKTGPQIFPNPTTGIVQVSNNLKGSLSVTDVYGKEVFTHSLDDQKAHLDLSFLPPGVYIAKIKSGEVYVRRIVIN